MTAFRSRIPRFLWPAIAAPTPAPAPFRWAEGQSVTPTGEQNFVKNADYFNDGLPYVDDLTIFGILDESAPPAAMLAPQTD